MARSNSKYFCVVIEYSSFLMLIIYLLGLLLFFMDVFLAFYRAQVEMVFINFNSSNCIIPNDEMDIRITRPLIEITSVFAVYILLTIWLAFYEWFRAPHWEYAVRLDRNHCFSELYKYVISNYPQCPVSDCGSISEARSCNCNTFLPSPHWIFSPESQNSSGSEIPQLLVMWFCSAMQILIIICARCFSTAQISYCNYEFVAALYCYCSHAFCAVLCFITLLSTFMALFIRRYYQAVEIKILSYLSFNRRIGAHESMHLLKLIGRNGLVYLVQVGDLGGSARMNYLLRLVIYEYYRLNELPLDLEDEKWNDFENNYIEYAHTGKKSTENTPIGKKYTHQVLDAILNSSTYENYDDLEASVHTDETEPPEILVS